MGMGDPERINDELGEAPREDRFHCSGFRANVEGVRRREGLGGIWRT